MLKQLKVGDVKGVDDGKTSGATIGCENGSIVTLVFATPVSIKVTDALARHLESLMLAEVVVQTP